MYLSDPSRRPWPISAIIWISRLQLAREAAAMVLLDDRFATVPAAIAQGRYAQALYLASDDRNGDPVGRE